MFYIYILFYFLLFFNTYFIIKSDYKCCNCKCKCKRNNNNLNLDYKSNNNKNKENNKDNDDKKEKEDKQETDIYSKNNGISPFKWDNVNCVLKSTITEFNNLCNYIPEIIERIKDENRIIKDSIDINIKKKIINEILNQRQQYLELKRGIDVDKLLDLIIEYVEVTIKTIHIEDLYQQKYKDLITLFNNIFTDNTLFGNLSKYLSPIFEFANINLDYDFFCIESLDKFKKIRNNIDLKNHNNKSDINLYQFFYFINNYITEFIDKVERKEINKSDKYDCYTIKNNKIKRYYSCNNITNFYKNVLNNNINNIISINLTGRYSSTLYHAISIQKYKNNYYFDSYNKYCNVSKEDILNYNFDKMFENHGKLTHKNTFEKINYIVTLET